MTEPSRNTPCPCGSGKKFKMCCMTVARTPNSGQPGVGRVAVGPSAAHLINSAIARYQAADLEGARTECEHALAQDSHATQALNLLGMIAMAQDEFAKACHLLDAAIKQVPTSPELHNNRGNALLELGRHGEAIRAFEEAIRLKGTYADPHNGIGNVLVVMKRHAEAIPHFRKAIALQPEYAQAFSNLGVAYNAIGEQGMAIEACKQAMRLDGALVEPCVALGDAYVARTQVDQAIPAYEHAARLRLLDVKILNSLGNGLQQLSRFSEAEAFYKQALSADPTIATTYTNLGHQYVTQGRFDEALSVYAAAFEIDPAYLPGIEGLFQLSRLHCDWAGIGELGARYESALHDALDHDTPTNTSPFNALNLPLAPLQQRALVEALAARISQPLQSLRGGAPAPRSPGGSPRLRIGYLSSDFRSHATAHLVGHLFALHNRARFEVIVYSTGQNDGSAYRKRFEQEAECFVDMQGWSPYQIAQRIHTDGVDILLDLHGHTMGSSLPALALRPAPLQIHFLGYPGTVGRDLVDYTLVDAVICPPEHESTFSEAVYRLPNCYQINDRQPIGETLPRAAYGLPDHGFIFCSFNATYKLTPAIFALWLRLLDRVPHSILWLYHSNEHAERNLRAEAARLGCPQEQLIFGDTLGKAEHLARLRHANLMLDTPVINGHTTVSDALWAGVPVLSILGQSFPDRVGASLLTAIGLPELIMPDLAAYEATAFRLATSPDELAALKAKLPANRLTTPLFDTPRFVRNLETAYEELWTRHLAVSR